MITKKDIDHLATLARIKLSDGEKNDLQKDLEKILEYFKELKEVKTDGVSPLSGGTLSQNIFREDEADETRLSEKDTQSAFPEEKDGFLRVPPVFE